MITKAVPEAPEALKGWDKWTGFGIDDEFKDDEYLSAKASWEQRKKMILQNRSDAGMDHVIMSDKMSIQSAKYLVKDQPKWVDMKAYRRKMRDTMGREWNLATEYFENIKPDYDIPSGYMLQPTVKEDDDEAEMNAKNQWGPQGKGGQEARRPKLVNTYRGDMRNTDGPRRNKNAGPTRQRA